MWTTTLEDGRTLFCFCPDDCGCHPWTTRPNVCGCRQHDGDSGSMCASCDGPVTTGYDYCERCRVLTGQDYAGAVQR